MQFLACYTNHDAIQNMRADKIKAMTISMASHPIQFQFIYTSVFIVSFFTLTSFVRMIICVIVENLERNKLIGERFFFSSFLFFAAIATKEITQNAKQ